MTENPSVSFEIRAKTDAGRRRPNNEDYVLIDTSKAPVIAIVADGAGGHSNGEVASKKAAEYTKAQLREAFAKNPKTTDEMKDVIRKVVQDVSRRIYSEAGSSPEEIRMASTLDLLVIYPQFVFTSHVGDGVICRRTKSKFFQVTSDHTVENKYVTAYKMSLEQARTTAKRISRNPAELYQAMGLPEIEPDVECFPVSPGDEYLLYSDGLSKTHTLSEISALLTQRSLDPSTFVSHVIDEANKRNAPDNLAVLLATTTARTTTSAVKPSEATKHGLTPNDQIEILSRIPFFALLNDLQINRVHNLGEIRSYEPSKPLFKKGDPSDAVMIILRGEVEVFGENSKTPISSVHVGEFVGETAILNQPNVRTATVVAKDKTRVLALPGDALKRLMATDLHLKAVVYEYLSDVIFEKNVRTSAISDQQSRNNRP
jgi:serine/threonine protein phosphatase PrpC